MESTRLCIVGLTPKNGITPDRPMCLDGLRDTLIVDLDMFIANPEKVMQMARLAAKGNSDA